MFDVCLFCADSVCRVVEECSEKILRYDNRQSWAVSESEMSRKCRASCELSDVLESTLTLLNHNLGGHLSF